MVDALPLLPLQSTVELVGAAVLLVVALVVIFKVIRLAYSIAVKIIVIAIAALIVLYALALAGINPIGLPTAVAPALFGF
ncbi:hypothetical protein [Haloarchaeobius iranensis]|uniref:Uncharacterized protein n=1 Tax=Haloarchaeobius iranensis TaxID=996166 RepID=A0A1G9X5K0_9EURY|nr:hypothetical protein [Haloarchaeobius iranensis]SDM92040.1 hypothetical protein SAMN05192554_109170 [Haloarchaeobius iranensis]